MSETTTGSLVILIEINVGYAAHVCYVTCIVL